MKKIALLNTVKETRELPDNSQIYFGHEFCFQMLPEVNEMEALSKIIKQKNIMFSFVTPYVNESDFDSMRSLLERLDKYFPGAEIVVNDWGILNYIKREFAFEIILGRLLVEQRKGFFINDNKKTKLIEKMKLSKSDKWYLRASVLNNDYLVTYLEENNIRRVGIDNLLMGINNNDTSLKVDLYYPYCYLTTSNYCRAYLAATNQINYKRTTGTCSRQCLQGTRYMKIANRKIFFRGNTQFYENKRLPRNMKNMNVDRIIMTKA